MEPQNSEEFLEKQREAWIKICLEHRQKEYFTELLHFISDALPEKVRKYDARLTFINHKFISNSISRYYYGGFVKINCHVFMIEYESVFLLIHTRKKGIIWILDMHIRTL